MADNDLPVFDPGVASGYSTNLLGTAGQAAPEAEPQIFVGYKRVATPFDPDLRIGPGGQGGQETGSTRQEILLTPTQLLSAFDKFDREDFLKFRNLFIAAGIVSAGADPLTVRSAYAALLSDVADMATKGIRVSPMGYVKNLIRMNGLDPSKVGAKENYDPLAEKEDPLEPWTKTSKSVYDLDPEDARATLESAITAKLGRAPTAEEIQDFINAAQHAAQKNPTTMTATFTPGGTDMTGESTSQTTSGGVTTQLSANGTTVITENQGFSAEDVARMAEKRAMAAPDYAGYQAVSTYFPALMQMLGAQTG